MSEKQAHITVLIGSPKGIEKSTSARLAKIITTGLGTDQWTNEWFHAHRVLQSDEAWNGLLASMARSDVILFAAPLYVDSLPAPVIETFYRLTQAKSTLVRDGLLPRMVSLLNCGFVEAHQNITAQSMVELFSRAMGFQWAGGISIGAGGMTNKRIREALESASSALRDDILISNSVDALTRKPIMKPWMYVLGGNVMWKKQAKANGLTPKQLTARPYEKSSRTG